MSDSSVTGQDIRAAAEVHSELGPEYGDAVVESFLARIDKQIEARVDERLAAAPRQRRQVDPARLSRYRIALGGAAAGSAVVGIPLSLIAARALSDNGNGPRALLVFWVVVLAVYGLAAYRLRRR